MESIKKILSEAGHFHCSYHRKKNIQKYLKGGKKTYLGMWLYEKLSGAMTTADIEQIKEESAPFMSNEALNYLNYLEDCEQILGPGAAKTLTTFSCIGILPHLQWNQ